MTQKIQQNLIKMSCSACKRINYYSTRNKKKLSDVKVNLKKHCKWCRKHTEHKERKK